MGNRFPIHYGRINEIVQDLIKRHPIRNILEVGCYIGHYVAFLRSEGFESVGIDSQKHFRKDIRQYLRQGQIESMKEIFGNSVFDLIVANRLLSISAQIDHLLEGSVAELVKVVELKFNGANTEEIDSKARGSIEVILMSCFYQLNQGGLFVDCEDSSPNERVGFSRETAERIGYKILSYKEDEAILQKPKNVQ